MQPRAVPQPLICYTDCLSMFLGVIKGGQLSMDK